MTAKLSCLLVAAMLVALGPASPGLHAQLPPDFPKFNITTYVTNAVADGDIFLAVYETSTNVGYYEMILKNDGNPVWYQHMTNSTVDFKVLPDGYLHDAEAYHILSWTGGADVYHQILDYSYNLQETVSTGNGHLPESHDLVMLPNGNVLALSYYLSQMDLSKAASGAYPNALVSGAVIQELNEQRNVVWQWRSWDHFAFQSYYAPLLAVNGMPLVRNPVVDSFHINAIVMDTDGNLLLSNYPLEVDKINRQTGDVMWRLGGIGNQFTFVGENPLVAAGHFGGHGLSRLANGDIMIFCNADQQATRSSKVYEYRLDETNKIATLVWSYAPATNWYSWHTGSAQRLSNGNTLIGWGSAAIVPGIGGFINQQVPACTEVTPGGQVVYQMFFNDPLVTSYRAYRFAYPVHAQATNVSQFELTLGNTYDFGGAGVSLTVTAGGGGYNALGITREPYSPIYPQFNGKPPVLLPLRLSLSENALSALGADFSFKVSALGIANPSNMTVYYRNTTGQGLFSAQTTDYNPITGTLDAHVDLAAQGNDFGEFAFGYPDAAEVPYPPILNAVENYRGLQPYEVIAPLQAVTGTVYAVNQQMPISLSWSPKGFAAWYALQIATDTNFTTPVVDEPYLTDANYVWSGASSSTLYYYRVKTSNDGGDGSWAAGAFQTMAPFVQVKAPNGGEAWRRGMPYFVQWNDDLGENVTIDLYKGGAFLRNVATNVPSTGAYKWSIPYSLLVPGSDYSIRITSATNSALFGASSQTFSIVDPPAFTAGPGAILSGGGVQFGLSAPGAATATVWASTNLVSWQSLQSVPITNGSAVFVDSAAPAAPQRYYRLSVP